MLIEDSNNGSKQQEGVGDIELIPPFENGSNICSNSREKRKKEVGCTHTMPNFEDAVRPKRAVVYCRVCDGGNKKQGGEKAKSRAHGSKGYNPNATNKRLG